MAITNGYCTLAEGKALLGITDSTDDTIIESMITSVCRWIDAYTGRHFYSATETRYYTPVDSTRLWVDDLVSITTLKTDEDQDRTYETTWAVTDYDLLPANAVLDGRPYTHIGLAPMGKYAFPALSVKGVQIVGVFGWSAVPATVKESCLLQTARIFKRKDTPLGIAGAPMLGEQRVNIPNLDPDVQHMLQEFRKIL